MQKIISSLFLLLLSLSCTPTENYELEDAVTLKIQKDKNDSSISTINGDIANKILLSHVENMNMTIKGISLWMEQIAGEKSNQGADCFQNYLCQFRVDHTALDIMDMEKKKHVATIALSSLGSSYHCNNADFGDTFYSDSDEFPLLYSSHQGRNARCILVDRIFKEDGEYKMETIQRIDLPWEVDEPLGYTPDAIVDNENNCLYVYTGNTIPITDFYIYKFRLPTHTEGNIKLSQEDILASWVINDCPSYYKQGGMVKDNILYIMEGVPGWQTDNILRIINLKDNIYTLINLSKDFYANWEPEDVFLYDNDFYIAANRSGVYHLKLESTSSSGIISPHM